MKHLLNTLFITSEDIYLSLDGENVVANRDKQAVARYPLHTLFGIVSFSYAGASPALMGACAQRGVSLSFCSPGGRFLARICGESSGNVLLRRAQYRVADDAELSCAAARTMIFGKLYNSRWSLERARRDHGLRINDERLKSASAQLQNLLPQVASAAHLDQLRGLEGVGAAAYFDVLDEMILNNKNEFFFHGRSRRPPLDAFNAMLSFAYSLLTNDCASGCAAISASWSTCWPVTRRWAASWISWCRKSTGRPTPSAPRPRMCSWSGSWWTSKPKSRKSANRYRTSNKPGRKAVLSCGNAARRCL